MDPQESKDRGLLVAMLDIQDLTVSYGKKIVLNEVSLSVSPGEVLALIGPNGAGKSTLIRAVSGVIPKRSGGMFWKENDLTKMSPSERARILAVVPQARQLGGAFSVEQTVMIGRTAYLNWLGQPQEDDLEQVRLAMEKTNISQLAHRKVAELSGGEQQRVFLARALAQTTPILLLDEPTTHLDLQHQAKLLSLVHDLAHDSGLVVLMALHDLNQVSLYADQVALLVEGKLKVVGTPKKVLTAERISDAYQTSIQVINHPEYNFPLIFPER